MATITSYPPGTLVRVTATFKTSSGVLIDPTTNRIVVQYMNNAKAVTTIPAGDPSIERDSVGVYHFDVSVPVTGSTGTWATRFYVPGPYLGQAGGITYFQIDPSPFG